MKDSFFESFMHAGARLIFWIAIVLLFIQLINAVAALVSLSQMAAQEFGPPVSFINVIPKLIESFVWPSFLLGISMVINRLDVLANRKGPRE